MKYFLISLTLLALVSCSIPSTQTQYIYGTPIPNPKSNYTENSGSQKTKEINEIKSNIKDIQDELKSNSQ